MKNKNIIDAIVGISANWYTDDNDYLEDVVADLHTLGVDVCPSGLGDLDDDLLSGLDMRDIYDYYVCYVTGNYHPNGCRITEDPDDPNNLYYRNPNPKFDVDVDDDNDDAPTSGEVMICWSQDMYGGCTNWGYVRGDVGDIAAIDDVGDIAIYDAADAADIISDLDDNYLDHGQASCTSYMIQNVA